LKLGETDECRGMQIKAVHNQGCDKDDVNHNWNRGKRSVIYMLVKHPKETDTRKQWMNVERSPHRQVNKEVLV
jgi:hypothetical protein